MKMSKSKISTAKQPTIEQLEKAFTIVAYTNLSMKSKKITDDTVGCEAKRLERCVEEFYTYTNHDMQYMEFAANFLTENLEEILSGNKFSSSYIDINNTHYSPSESPLYNIML
tara:strand:+ start:466 stop:804 length:339 start_codon:yes stop_codon:yes gene_type:complete